MRKWVVVSLLLLVADQFTKIWATASLPPKTSISLLPGILSLHYTQNTGMAFSLGSSSGILPMLLGGLLLTGLLLIAFLLKDLPSLSRRALIPVAAGGLGNWLDRIRLGYVIDFLKTDFMNFPVFNLADVAICTGVGLAILGLLMADRNKKRS